MRINARTSKRLLLLGLALLLAVAATGVRSEDTTTAASSGYLVPNGSYLRTCKNCQFDGGPTFYMCLCNDTNNPTSIDLTTCTRQPDGWYWLVNTHGKLECATQG